MLPQSSRCSLCGCCSAADLVGTPHMTDVHCPQRSVVRSGAGPGIVVFKRCARAADALCSVLIRLVPAAQAEHDVRSVFTTEGGCIHYTRFRMKNTKGRSILRRKTVLCRCAPWLTTLTDDCAELRPTKLTSYACASAALTSPVSHCTQSAGDLQPPPESKWDTLDQQGMQSLAHILFED